MAYKSVLGIARELSALAVSKLSSEGAYAVGGVSGLQLQIIGASKVWVLRFSINGKRRRMGLGSFPAVSLANAREAGRQAQDLIRSGNDPINDRDSAGERGHPHAWRRWVDQQDTDGTRRRP